MDHSPQAWTRHVPEPKPFFRGEVRSRTFETAFSNTVPCKTGAPRDGGGWYLNDPRRQSTMIGDYQKMGNPPCRLAISNLEVAHYEVAPWPERIFRRRALSRSAARRPKTISAILRNRIANGRNVALNAGSKANRVGLRHHSGSVCSRSDSLMFERAILRRAIRHLSQIMASPCRC